MYLRPLRVAMVWSIYFISIFCKKILAKNKRKSCTEFYLKTGNYHKYVRIPLTIVSQLNTDDYLKPDQN